MKTHELKKYEQFDQLLIWMWRGLILLLMIVAYIYLISIFVMGLPYISNLTWLHQLEIVALFLILFGLVVTLGYTFSKSMEKHLL